MHTICTLWKIANETRRHKFDSTHYRKKQGYGKASLHTQKYRKNNNRTLAEETLYTAAADMIQRR